MRHRLATIVRTAVGLGVAGLAGGFLFNLDADTGHWPVTRWFLGFSVRNAVETHAFWA